MLRISNQPTNQQTKKTQLLKTDAHFPGVNPTTPEADENLKSCLSTEIPSKGHLSSGVWRQPKEGKEWGEEYVTKDHPDKLKEPSPGRHSSLENVLGETSLAGKFQERGQAETVQNRMEPGWSTQSPSNFSAAGRGAGFLFRGRSQ